MKDSHLIASNLKDSWLFDLFIIGFFFFRVRTQQSTADDLFWFLCHFLDAYDTSKMLCEQYYLTSPDMEIIEVNCKSCQPITKVVVYISLVCLKLLPILSPGCFAWIVWAVAVCVTIVVPLKSNWTFRCRNQSLLVRVKSFVSVSRRPGPPRANVDVPHFEE